MILINWTHTRTAYFHRTLNTHLFCYYYMEHGMQTIQSGWQHRREYLLQTSQTTIPSSSGMVDRDIALDSEWPAELTLSTNNKIIDCFVLVQVITNHLGVCVCVYIYIYIYIYIHIHIYTHKSSSFNYHGSQKWYPTNHFLSEYATDHFVLKNKQLII